MLSLLLDKDFWLLIICVVAIGALIWAWVKFKSARVIISTIAVVVMCGFTTYAGFYINSYYSAEGGIYGQISNLFSPSFEIDVEDLKLSFDDIQLLQENDSDRYYAYLQTSQVLSIDNDTDYSICVNGKECDSVVTSDYISADFTLAFYNLANTEIMYVDTLHISISLNLNNTYTYVYTDNGLTCGSYWTQYFRNNGFVLTIVESTQTSTITFAEEDTDTLAYYRNLVASLSKQVTTLQEQLSQYEDTDSPTIAELESEIESLQADIATLKKLLESYADADEAVVYFYYDNELIASPIMTIGTKLADIDVDVPESTDYIVFNGWTVNGDSVDSKYEITGTTTFVADLTYYYDVIFYVDDTAYSSQVVVKNGYATAPVDPTIEDYSFQGWTIDKENVVDVTSYVISGSTAFYSLFSYYYWDEIVWSNESSVYSYNFFGSYVEEFYGVAYETTHLLEFVEDNFSYYSTDFFDSLLEICAISSGDFWTDGTTYFYSGLTSDYATAENFLTHAYYDVILQSWIECDWDGIYFFGSSVWSDGVNVYVSDGEDQYVLDTKNHTYEIMSWNGLASFYGNYIWTDGVNYYYSYGDEQYVLYTTTDTWLEVTWQGLSSFMGGCIWTDGTDYYYSGSDGQYVLQIENYTWVEMEWNIDILSGGYIWSVNNFIFYSAGGSQYVLIQSYLN